MIGKGEAGGHSSLSCAQLSMQLSRVSDLLILSGDSSHESEQYGRLAEQLGAWGDKSVELVEEEGYKGFSVRSRTLLAGILKDIEEKGVLSILLLLRAKVPASLRELLRVRGLNATGVRTLLEGPLKIESVEMLQAACAAGLLEKQKGFGKKTVARMASRLEFYLLHRDRLIFPDALALAEGIEGCLAEIEGKKSSQVAVWARSGLLLRGAEVVDTLCWVWCVEGGMFQADALSLIENVCRAGGTRDRRGVLQADICFSLCYGGKDKSFFARIGVVCSAQRRQGAGIITQQQFACPFTIWRARGGFFPHFF